MVPFESEQNSSPFQNRRIALFEPHQDLGTNPSLVCLIEALTLAGARVDIFMPDTDHFPVLNTSAAVYPFPKAFSLWGGGARRTYQNWVEYFRFPRSRVQRSFAAGHYDLIIGVDSLGVIAGYEYAYRFNVPLVYLSFEIFFMDELTDERHVNEKNDEYIASRFSSLIIVQDRWRAQLLSDENKLALEKFATLPVSPAGRPEKARENFIRQRFNIPQKQTIVIHSGSFAPWTCADELIENILLWPKDFTLVIHTRYNSKRTDKYARKIKEERLGNVILSTHPLPIHEYGQLVSSADIGLVLYKSDPPTRYNQKNLQNIGLASGKFSYYMKYGLPIISINQKYYTALLAEYDFGLNVDSFLHMPGALKRIQANLGDHKREARRLYSEKLDFNIHWPHLADRLLAIMGQTP